ncbi:MULTISPECIES: quinone oxidoreductase family protein [Mycolicibacterium]|nr:zinc-binding dehydrogenase [Mycolicibacterium llatzerense]
MKAIELTALDGFDSLRLSEVGKPSPAPGEVLIKVRAAGINYAELEQTTGRYPLQRPLPTVLGFEAAGEIVELGSGVEKLNIGDTIAAPVLSGGYAEFATARADSAFRIPEGIDFAQATSIVVQGLSAWALLKLAAKPTSTDTVLIQAAAGGVGLYLVQLAKALGVGQVIALASTAEKRDLVTELGADVAIDYTQQGWGEKVLEHTDGRGVDVVMEMASGETGKASFSLLAPFGRVVMFGAKNAHDALRPEQVRQLIHNNQTVIGFNFPSLRPNDLRPLVPELLNLISQGRVRIIADRPYPLAEAKEAFHAIASRQTIGKVVLVP